MSTSSILRIAPLGFPWQTIDPFLFCVHHLDHYPQGNASMGPAASLAGRNLGQDFAGKDGWSMYHGMTIPGFPAHPHRGFETVTIVRQGHIDHSDSLGATARFGPGDVQWLTAGEGIVHCEMFPLRHTDQANTAELFQIWLNLPASHKMVKPHFTMLWGEQIQDVHHVDAQGLATDIRVVAGSLDQAQGLAPPPDSWARPHQHIRKSIDRCFFMTLLSPIAGIGSTVVQPIAHLVQCAMGFWFGSDRSTSRFHWLVLARRSRAWFVLLARG